MNNVEMYETNGGTGLMAKLGERVFNVIVDLIIAGGLIKAKEFAYRNHVFLTKAEWYEISQTEAYAD